MQIYQILNKVTGKSYIGKSKNYKKRFMIHLKHAAGKINRRLYDSINYHGVESFELILLEDLGECSRELANEREIHWILKIDSLMPNGYNMTSGGDGGDTLYSWDDESKRLLWKEQAAKRTGIKWTEDRKINLSNSTKGRVISDNQRLSISKTLKDRYEKGEIVAVTPILYGSKNPNWVEIDIENVLNKIRICHTLKQIAESYNIRTATVGDRLKIETGKTFIQWRREYGIVGKLSNPRPR
jgi:group I intron endonuclease